MQTLKPVDVVIAGGGFVGLTLAKEITARTPLSVAVLGRGQGRKAGEYASGMDELDYALRYRMMQNLAVETATHRHAARAAAVPIRQYGSFNPGTGVGARASTGAGSRTASIRSTSRWPRTCASGSARVFLKASLSRNGACATTRSRPYYWCGRLFWHWREECAKECVSRWISCLGAASLGPHAWPRPRWPARRARGRQTTSRHSGPASAGSSSS